MPSHGQDVYTVSLNKYTTEYDKISKQFYATAKGVTISRIERIQNPWLYRSYILSKERMEKTDGTSNERLLFHATSFRCVKSINSGGLKRNLNVAHGEYINRFATEPPVYIHVPISACDVIFVIFVVSPRLPPFFSASIREGRVAVSVDHPRGTHSRYVIGCCLIPFGICGVKNNSRRITYGIGYVWRMPSLSPLFSLAVIRNFVKTSLASEDSKYAP